MSPRRTETFHEVGDGQHLGPVVFIRFKGGNLGGEGVFVGES